MTDLRKYVLAFLISCVLVSLAVFVHGCHRQTQLLTTAETASRETDHQIAAADAVIAARDRATAAATVQLTRQEEVIHTPQQAVKVLVRYLPAPAAPAGSAVPPESPAAPVTVERAELSPALQATLPAAPSFTLFTPAQTVAVARDELRCDATTRQLATCQADAVDLHSQLAAAEGETKAWRTAARGGTRLARLGRVLKLVACAGAGAGAGALVDRHAPAIGSAIGGSAAVATCSLF